MIVILHWATICWFIFLFELSHKNNRPSLNFHLPLTTMTMYSICTILASLWSWIFLNANAVLHYLQLSVLLEMWLLALSRKYFWIFNNKTRLRLYKMNLQSFKLAATGNSKLVYWKVQGILVNDGNEASPNSPFSQHVVFDSGSLPLPLRPGTESSCATALGRATLAGNALDKIVLWKTDNK